MNRQDSQILRKKIAEAKAKGYARKCIKERCACWSVCCNDDEARESVCLYDLETNFYHNSVELTCEGEDYRPETRRRKYKKNKTKTKTPKTKTHG